MPEPSSHGEPHVLVVDDDPKNLFALEAVLEDLSVRVHRATSGEEALRQVLKHQFAAILLDVRMPGIDGFETAAAIRSLERLRHVPIIFLSAYADRRANERDSFCDFVLKPITADVIRTKVGTWLERYRTSQ
jgi:CheY-like chemotaxis protein